MKLGEGGEAFFVFETSESIPQDMQTSPLISPITSPQSQPTGDAPSIALPEPEPLDLAKDGDVLRQGASEHFGPLIDRPKSADGKNYVLSIMEKQLTYDNRYTRGT
jgi:phosphatidate phosphatase LPIN